MNTLGLSRLSIPQDVFTRAIPSKVKLVIRQCDMSAAWMRQLHFGAILGTRKRHRNSNGTKSFFEQLSEPSKTH